jgi:GR25 family glycosyltransferase involved in LPS biosynthesis
MFKNIIRIYINICTKHVINNIILYIYIYMFDKIYYINLSRRPDRNNNITEIINKLQLDNITTRVPAIDGKQLNLDKMPKKIITAKGIEDAKNTKQKVYAPLTYGAIGCALSHRTVWQMIVENKLKNALILEDDINIDKNFEKKLKNYKNHLPTDYDMVFLGYHRTSINHGVKNINSIYMKCNRIYGLFGYIVSNKGAHKLLNLFPITQQIDTVISDNLHKFTTYVVKPEHRIIFSDPSALDTKFGTDIQVRENFNGEVKIKRNKCNISKTFIITIVLIVIIYYELVKRLIIQK